MLSNLCLGQNVSKRPIRSPGPPPAGAAASPGLGIAAVERDTGLPKDTLRVWERRYGFPAPVRDAAGERLYPPDQVERLRLIRRLVDSGHRPGRVVALPEAELRAMSVAPGSVEPTRDFGGEDLETCEALLRAHRVEEFRAHLSGAALRLGLERFVADVCAPLTRRVGESWARGDLEIFEEHLYTESLQSVLRAAIAAIPGPGVRPRVLLTTLPCEPHGLGLLMVEALMALHGASCLSLGTRTPVRDIALAVRSRQSDVVALSFTGVVPAGALGDGLAELRSALSPEVEIWAGGGSEALRRRRIEGVQVIPSLEAIAPEIARWRSEPRGA